MFFSFHEKTLATKKVRKADAVYVMKHKYTYRKVGSKWRCFYVSNNFIIWRYEIGLLRLGFLFVCLQLINVIWMVKHIARTQLNVQWCQIPKTMMIITIITKNKYLTYRSLCISFLFIDLSSMYCFGKRLTCVIYVHQHWKSLNKLVPVTLLTNAK